MARDLVLSALLCACSLACRAPTPSSHVALIPLASRAPASPQPTPVVAVGVTVTPEHVEIPRTGHDPIVIQLPVVAGLEDVLTPTKLLGDSLESLRDEAKSVTAADPIPGGLQGASFSVLYNKDGILEIDETGEWMGAYPSSFRFHVLVDVRMHRVIAARDAFRASSLPSLVARVGTMLKAEIAASDAAKDPTFADLVKDHTASEEDLDDFSVSDAGVTFHYHYGFPHVALALEPPGDFAFSWREIEADVEPSGPLRRFVGKP